MRQSARYSSPFSAIWSASADGPTVPEVARRIQAEPLSRTSIGKKISEQPRSMNGRSDDRVSLDVALV